MGAASGIATRGDGKVVDGIAPSPAQQDSPQRDGDLASARAAVDAAWYRGCPSGHRSGGRGSGGALPGQRLAGGAVAEHAPSIPPSTRRRFPPLPAIGDPLLHYLEHGEAAGHTGPSAGSTRTGIAAPTVWRLTNPPSPTTSAIRLEGWVSPNPDFDARFYMERRTPTWRRRDWTRSNTIWRAAERKAGCPVTRGTSCALPGLIDPNYYYINGPDVHQAGLDAGRSLRVRWLARISGAPIPISTASGTGSVTRRRRP